MKNAFRVLWTFLAVLLLPAPVWADTAMVAPQPGSMRVPEMPISIEEKGGAEFEGWIVGVNYLENRIVVHDSDGKDRRVRIRQGMISHFKVDSRVRVRMMADGREAEMIWILR